MSYLSEVLADTPLFYARMSSGAAVAWPDSSGNGRNGSTITGSSGTLQAAGLLVGDSDTCFAATGAGATDYRHVVADAAWMDVTTITLEAMIRPSAIGSIASILDRDTLGFGTDRVFQFRINASGKLELVYWLSGSGPFIATGATTLAANTTYHVAATYDGTTAKVFLNGVQDGSDAHSGTLKTGTGQFAACGNYSAGTSPAQAFNGKIDEVAYYGSALSSARLLVHYNAAITASVAGSLATETDTPLAGTTDLSVAGGLATETDTALAGGTSISIAGGLATETDTPLTGSVADWLYQVFLKVGDHEWTIHAGDTVDPDDDLLVLDGLTLGWQVDESAPWPAQPDPPACTVGFYTTDVAELADVTIGTPMSVVLTYADGNVFGTFHGRVGEQTATPIKRKAGLRMLFAFAGVGYTVDLDELPVVVDVDWPAESADDRFARIAAAILTAGGPVLEVPADTGAAAFEALTAGTTTAGTLVADHLAQVAIDTGDGPQRYIVVPVVIDDLLDRFECVLIDRVVDAALLPGTLDVVDGLLTLVFDDLTADGVVDAGHVDLDTSWKRLKYRAVNRVTVAGETFTVEATRPGPPVRLTLSTTLTDVDAGQLMANLYLPDVDETNGWVADTFRLYAHLDPASIVPSWFPDHRDDPATTAVYVMPVAILRIPPAMNLAGNTVYAGQLTTVQLTIEKQKILVDFSLRRQLPLGTGAEAASWDWLAATFPTITWDDVDPDMSWYEARLARRS